MTQIKFSHEYPKLWKQNTAELLLVRLLNAASVHTDLKEYDTKYVTNVRTDHHGNVQDVDEDYYLLPTTGKLIQLVFIGDKHIPFCTLRRYTPDKFTYYNGMIGRQFSIARV